MPKLNYNKYDLVNEVLRPDVHTVLDVGCRDAIMKRYLRGDICYTGIDLMPGLEVDRVGNVEQGLPFGDGEFDAVIALDLLEHTNDIWFVFDEFFRVARRQVIVIIPNAYHWSFRLQYLFGKEMAKYILPPEPILDRHRWLISYRTASDFCVSRAEKAGWQTSEKILSGGRRYALIDWALAPLSKNLAAWAVVYVLEKNEAQA
ncbi:MAG: hypothetical protein A2512_10595 [Deltaproteobacteria bacterium RIFOXYD12_FULL_56_24]|nr:MAG: hypothetical protein A2512_10595 [Deltaproteobacteria bacterium RIFOXYD12_FULL_56_24]